MSSLITILAIPEQGPDGSEELSSRSDEPLPEPQRLGNGVVQRAVVKVLAMAGRPMRLAEVHRATEDLLSISVSKDSVNSCLSTKARGKDPWFVRTEPGVYRLGVDMKTVFEQFGLAIRPQAGSSHR